MIRISVVIGEPTQTRLSSMPYQYKREPLTQDEANRLANACHTHEERAGPEK